MGVLSAICFPQPQCVSNPFETNRRYVISTLGYEETRNSEDNNGRLSLDRDDTDAAPLLAHRQSDVPPFGWRPFCLRWRILSVFLSVFITIAGSIYEISRRSKQENGILTANKLMYYLWMFGLTISKLPNNSQVSPRIKLCVVIAVLCLSGVESNCKP